MSRPRRRRIRHHTIVRIRVDTGQSNWWYTSSMRYLLAIAVLLAGLSYPLSLHAQRLGAVRSFAPARGGFATRASRPATASTRVIRTKPAPGPRSARHGSVSRPPHRYQLNSGYWPGTPCLTNPGYANSYFCRQYLPPQNYSYAPFYGLPLWYGLPAYPSQEEEASTPAPAPEENAALAGQVERLAEEVELLREERLSGPAPSPAAAAPLPEEKRPAAVLVYRDGHKGEAENYAVLGQTLYVFEGERTRRIPLAELDLDATQRLNEEQGVEFVPAATR